MFYDMLIGLYGKDVHVYAHDWNMYIYGVVCCLCQMQNVVCCQLELLSPKNTLTDHWICFHGPWGDGMSLEDTRRDLGNEIGSQLPSINLTQ